VTGELENLSIHDNGGDQVYTPSGTGMRIDHVGHGFLHSPIRKIRLKNILHVPHDTKNLLFVNCLVRDNTLFWNFTPLIFLSRTRR
jgi:hypothetical protein